MSSKVFHPSNGRTLTDFLKKLYNIAVNNPNDLFILKEKKTELNEISDKLEKEMKTLDNIYIVKTDKHYTDVKVVPYLSLYNHYEDLLNIANIVISFHFASTTVWQALSNKIPTICYNHSFEHSFLNEYQYLEVRKSELEKSFSYWKNKDTVSFQEFLRDLDSKINILGEDSLKNMLESISELVE